MHIEEMRWGGEVREGGAGGGMVVRWFYTGGEYM